MGLRGAHRMNGEEGRAGSAEEKAVDRRRSLRLWALIGFLTGAVTALGLLP